MPPTRTLNHSPSLAEVSQARAAFEAAHGPADVLYTGELRDPFDGWVYDFGVAIPIARLSPMSNRMVVSLLDGFVPWSTCPVEPYRFELISRDGQSARPPVLDESSLEWLDVYRPYAEARKINELDAALTALGFRAPVDALADGTIMAAFRAKSSRCGIYVLHFANGEHYVGQTVDIIRRLTEHRRRHGDVTRVSFRPLPQGELYFHESLLISLLEAQGYRLRNIDLTSLLVAEPGSFDAIMDAEHQQRWLTDVSYVDLRGPRKMATGSRTTHCERLADLKSRDMGRQYAELLPVVRAYVYHAIPAVLGGEANYWQASVLPPTDSALVRINISRQEVFAAIRLPQRTYFYTFLSRRKLQQTFGAELDLLRTCYPTLEILEREWRAGGSDQACVRIDDVPSILRFISDPDVIPALRLFNLRLAKRGACPWARSHSFELISDILSEHGAPKA